VPDVRRPDSPIRFRVSRPIPLDLLTSGTSRSLETRTAFASGDDALGTPVLQFGEEPHVGFTSRPAIADRATAQTA